MEVEAVRCECCGFVEECTPQYIAEVREAYLGRWVCGLCAEAVGDEVRRSGAGERPITKAEALDRHVAFARSKPAPPGRAAEDLVAAVARLLRRCLDSPPSPAASPAGAEGGARLLGRNAGRLTRPSERSERFSKTAGLRGFALW